LSKAIIDLANELTLRNQGEIGCSGLEALDFNRIESVVCLTL